MRSAIILSAVACSLAVFALPAGPGPKHHDSGIGSGHDRRDDTDVQSVNIAADRASAVKATFEIAWEGYYTHAFPNDELCPYNNGFSNNFAGWGATAIDAFTTALIMELPIPVAQILDHIPTINWGKSYNDSQVNLFETTIRYMGGLMSGYDLLNGPLKHLVNESSQVDILLEQAQHLANNLTIAFETPTEIPHNGVWVNNRTTDDNDINGLASVGSLVLEWTRLSDLTGDQTYARLAERAESFLLNPQPASSEPWPGLVGGSINITSGEFDGALGGWAGGTDSFYEYLLKMYVYDTSRFSNYLDRWVLAADSTMQHLASHPTTRPDLTFLAQFNNTELLLTSNHLVCFDGGNFILGGLVLNEQKYIDFGLDLVTSCEETYRQTLTGIGPDAFQWDANNVPPEQKEFFERAGFYITNGIYLLRPEVMESFYYAYRATGDSKYQDWSWNAFEAISNRTRIGSGYARVLDVNAPSAGGGFVDVQDSFFFAELLKYSYLIHAPDSVFQVEHDGVNEFVFNTEGHPFKVAGSPV